MINAMPARGPSFFRRGRILEVESACIVDGLFHSLALLY